MGQAEIVYDSLSSAILEGRYPPGAKLSEPVIAEELGLSRAPVREAIRRLQERGIVAHEPYHGVRVISPSLDDYLALLDVREELEGMACRLAATTMSDAALRDLEVLVEAHGRMIDADPAGSYLQADRDADFHVRIAEGCGNPVLSNLLCADMYPRLKLCRLQHRGMKGRGRTAWQEHRLIMCALADRDTQLAELMMRRHVRAARAALIATQRV